MEYRLDESRANIIRNAICNDGTFCGTPEWLDNHNVTRDEFLAFLDYAVRLAKQLDFEEENRDVGAVDVLMTFTKHSGKVGDVEESWTVFIPQQFTRDILTVAQHGKVVATLVPEQMALPIGDNIGMFDTVTGEVIA